MVIMGNCLAETLGAGLSANPILASSFRFIVVPAHLKTLADPKVREALGQAGQIFLQRNAAPQAEVRACARADTRITLYPEVVQRSPWPFDAESAYRDDAIVDTPTAVIRHHDGVLARLRTAEPDPRGRFERDRALFHDSTHPSATMFQALGGLAWRTLDMAGRPPVFTGMDIWKAWRVPVHPAIAKTLGLNWATERTRYTYATLGEVTWEQWVRAYIECCG